MSATKIGENTTNISKLLFFTINLHFVTSNQLSTYRKLNFPFIKSVYFAFFPQEMQKRLEQTKVYHPFSHFFWKETTHKLLKVTAARILFSHVYVITTTCFDVFYSMCYLKEIAFHESLSLLWDCLKRHVAAFFEASVFQEVRILCFISAITIRC